MFCGNCGSPLKDTDKFCAKCGWKNPKAQTIDQKAGPSADNVFAAENPITNGAIPSISDLSQGMSSEPPKASSHFPQISFKVPSFLKSPKGIICIAAVLVLFIGVMNHAVIGNLFRKTFYSPEKYYQYVEKQQIKDAAAMVSDIYNNRIKDTRDPDNFSIDSRIKVELGESGQDMISLLGLAGVDLSWLDSVQLAVNASSSKQDTMSSGMEAYLNGDKLISANIILDLAENAVYLQSPELSDNYLGMETELDDLSAMINSGMTSSEVPQKLKEIFDQFPDRKTVERLLIKYGNLALKCIDDVDMGKNVTLKAEGVSQKCTKLTVTLDDETFQTILENILKEAVKDKELEKVIRNAASLDETLDADEIYEAFQASLENSLDYLSFRTGSEIEMCIWVDNKGEVKGRTIEMDYGFSKNSIEFFMPQKGKHFGYELSAKTDGISVSLEGSGKRSGDKLSGDFQVKYNGAGLVDIAVKNYNTKKAKEGYVNGSFTVSPSSALMSLIPGIDFIGRSSLEMNLKQAKDDLSLAMTVIYDDERLGTLQVDSKIGNGKKAKIPRQKDVIWAEDDEDIEEYLETIDWDSFISKLEDAGAPSFAVNYLERMIDMLQYY